MQSEFEFISRMKERYRLDKVGDDCAVLPMNADHDLVVTADMLVEDVDFRLKWAPPRSVGHKALAVSLSDIAAMGAEPTWAMISLAVPEKLWKSDFLEKFYEGWHALARRFNVELAGGDVSRTSGPLVIDSIVGGRVPKGKAILRSGARPGDAIFVSGCLGGALGGLEILERSNSGGGTAARLVIRQLEPEPQLTLANLLQCMGITSSLIDISDGLSSDLRHICEASRVGAVIYADALPVHINLRDHFGIEQARSMAVNGGEDFELLFTSSEKTFSLPQNHQIHRIGEITANVGVIELITANNTSVLEPKGYLHF